MEAKEKERGIVIIGNSKISAIASNIATRNGLVVETVLPSDPLYFKSTCEKVSESIVNLSKEINDLNKTYYEPKGSKYHK